ncbi:S-layer homology domain-containing protein [Paenibacillus tengchongensis]|uniref:S-layer homology domain-containing protein n=1 Tax=Paenibacillus tengchongensis TaxID=2608684 RepID=UPI00124CC1E0|nr:S-layer homology domain-containing protein [Paenibacillus tengchongensis]
MQRIKRPFLWLVMAAMIITLFPAGLIQPVSAAGLTSTTYFSPDNLDLRKTIQLTQTSGTQATDLNRDTAYKTSSPTLSITGTYSQVTSTTMTVTVEQLTLTGSAWTTDATHVTTGTVTVDTTSPDNRFITNGLTLYSGFNKITFSGMQGNLKRSESFYVLYDKVPYVTSLKVLGSGASDINLNEGTQVVVSSPTITLQGNVANATKVTIALNGGTALQTSLLEDGSFYTPTLNLNSGLNTIRVVIQNASDSITVDRSLYYFDTTQPFTDLQLQQGSRVYNILDNTPTLTVEDTTVAIIGQVLLPYSASPSSFGSVGSIKLDGGSAAIPFTVLKSYSVNATTGQVTVTPGTDSDEVIIPGPDGVTPAYRLVTFKTNTFTIPDTKGTKSLTLGITYGTFQTSKVTSYKYMPGETVIKNMYYLPGYNGTGDLASVSRLPLEGTQVESADFYILVKGSKDLDNSDVLTGIYLPLSNKALNLTRVTPSAGLAADEQVYKISGFSNGQQQVRFQFKDSQSYLNVKIAYVSKNYIYIDNLFDGQTYEFNSKQNNSLTISGEYIGFENISSAQFFINGVSNEKLGITFAVPGTGTTPVTKFTIPLAIKSDGPLLYGENKIVFTGVSTDDAGNKREIRKEIRIYIIDTNVSTLSQFHPALSAGRAEFNHDAVADYTSAELSKILDPAAEFVYSDSKYTTNQTSYDLVLRGSGATTLNLYYGSELFFTSASNAEMLDSENKRANPGSFTFNGKTYYYDYAGSTKDFMLRIRGIDFETPGSHVYNLELLNDTGARTTQRLEIVREVSPYLVLSPVATVGDQIVVNKNFVRFDIEAEGATKVLIDKYEATPRADLTNRFVYDYVGLKPDKATSIKITIVRADSTLNDTVTVYYASAVQVDTQYMAEKVANKYTVFNKGLELTFPKGTVMQGYTTTGASKYYPDMKLLFGIADPVDGVVERKNDYGNTINIDADARTTNGASTVLIPSDLVVRFNSTIATNNFSRVSDIYWLNGGLGEEGVKGTAGYKAASNGIAPYSLQGNFTQFSSNRKIVPSQRGELTLSFNSNVVDDVGTTVTVFRYTDTGSWENIGGEVNTSNHTITVPFDEFGYYTVMKLRRGYTDITNHPWARNILNGLYSKGIMTNLRTDAFGADDTTTRGEFATLLVKGLNIPLDYDTNKQTFFDIVPEAVAATWNFKTIETAARAGIVTGLSDGFFGPDQALTREQAAVMIARALKLKMNANNDKLTASLGKSFVDVGSMDYYSRPAIEAVSKAKIMEGSAVTVTGQSKAVYNFNPKGKLTRAEAGKIAVALLQKSTSIFPKNFN